VLGILGIAIATPSAVVRANHANVPDIAPTNVNMVRSGPLANGSYSYQFYWNDCEIDNHTWSQFAGNITYTFRLWNSPQGTEMSDTIGPFYVSLTAGTCDGGHSLNPPYYFQTMYCCGAVIINDQSGTDTDTTNNRANDNNPRAAVLPAIAEIVNVVVNNWEDVAVVFDNYVDYGSVPAGWEVSIDEPTITVQAGALRTFEVEIVPPSTITSWPQILVGSKSASNPGVDQVTMVSVVDGTVLTDECT